MTFEQMNLDKNIIQALHTLEYEKPLPVQEKVHIQHFIRFIQYYIFNF